jgi:hypothetical protein
MQTSDMLEYVGDSFEEIFGEGAERVVEEAQHELRWCGKM